MLMTLRPLSLIILAAKHISVPTASKLRVHDNSHKLRFKSTTSTARKMSRNITVTFLGTTSGGGPTETRNCSSLVVEPLGDGSLWMVDCAEGTVRQFALQPFNRNTENRRLRVSQVSKIFVTHMHDVSEAVSVPVGR
ncbi:hypothetical protein OH77DRAFT_151898 [Trametes cingulata]|nr:hypothetical protein OH77DRAFT_151898 [Trametes cingulata]